MERSEERRLGQSGQALILFTLMLVAFLGFCALVVDVGRVYAERRYMQNGADAGALAIGAVLSKSYAPCSAGQGCVDGVGTLMSEADAVRLAQAEADSNASLLSGFQDATHLGNYTAPIAVMVQYVRWGTTNYITMDPNSGATLPGDTFKIRVVDQSSWTSWFPLPTGGADLLRKEPAQAAADAVVMIKGSDSVPTYSSWPMVRRRSTVDPTQQRLDTRTPYEFWSANVVNQVDKAGSSWKAMIDYSLYSDRFNGAGYSTSTSRKIQAIEQARAYKYDTVAWPTNYDDMSCNNGMTVGYCGRTWDTRANTPLIGNLPPLVSADNPRDPQNRIYYGMNNLSLTNQWWTKSCTETGGTAGDCGVPDQATLDTQPNTPGHYALGAVPSDFRLDYWPAEGDWVETYPGGSLGGGNWGTGVFAELRDYIQRHGELCAFTNKTVTYKNQTVIGGPCANVTIYLWEGAQYYNSGGTTPATWWRPWDASGNTPPDRVHIVDWWNFSFYLNLVDDISNSHVVGFWTSVGAEGIPDPDTSGKPNGKFDYYFPVGG
jgi:Flp pilus assembly protein TadG